MRLREFKAELQDVGIEVSENDTMETLLNKVRMEIARW